MEHDRLSLQVETGKATVQLIATLIGGVLVLSSFVAQWVFPDSTALHGEKPAHFYRDVLAAVRDDGGEPIGVAVLVDRSAGRVDFGIPFFACAALDLPAYQPSECPLCAANMDLIET